MAYSTSRQYQDKLKGFCDNVVEPLVNHIDSNRTNNNINNLEWCTYKENTQWALKNGRFDNMSKQNSIRLKNNPLNGYIYANEITKKNSDGEYQSISLGL